MTGFVDTSALYALLDRNDRFHEDARVTGAELLSDATALMTSNYVLVETFALVQRRLEMEAVRGCADRLLPVSKRCGWRTMIMKPRLERLWPPTVETRAWWAVLASPSCVDLAFGE